MYLMDYYTIPMSLAGLPSLSVPCGWSAPTGALSPMPLGLELSGPLFAEASLLGIAHAYEKSTRHAQTVALPTIPHVPAGAPA
jgi:aspartyl-tRNA(Asn)/glutamyl-tRNA(Gln) amidotransferase subunit A